MLTLLGPRENARHVHLIEADVKTNGASHKEVIVMADDCAIGTVGLALIGEQLIECATIALSEEHLTDSLDECGYNHRLCADVGVETIFARETLPNLIFGLTPGIDVGIERGNLIENIVRLIATFYLTLAVVGLQCVGLNDE